MAKYLICLPRYHTNAVPWVRILQSAGHHVAVHVVEAGRTESYLLLRPSHIQPSALSRLLMRVFGSGGINSPLSFPPLRCYWRQLRAIDPDVVIVRGITRWFSRVVTVCALAQRRTLIVYDQEAEAPKPWSSTWLRRATMRLLGVRHFTSKIAVTTVRPSLGNAVPLPFGCSFESDAHVLGARELNWPPRILMVAKYRDRKGHRKLLEALALLIHSHEFRLTFCGEEASASDTEFCRSLAAYATTLGLSGRLEFRNNVPYEQMPGMYAVHDVFVLPSSSEPAAVAPIEAAWAGCAVLMSRDGGTRGYLPPGDDFDFDPNSPTDIARALRGVLSAPEALRIMQHRCFESVARIGNGNRILHIFESFVVQESL